MELQEIVFNIFYVCIVITIAFTLFFDIMKKRKWRNTSIADEERLPELLEKLPEKDYIVIKDVNVMTKLGRSRADYIIVSIYGIFSLEFRSFYFYIGGQEYTMKWKKSMRFKKENFMSPLWEAKVHMLAIKDAIAAAGIEEKEDARYMAMAGFPSFVDDRYVELSEVTSFSGKVDEIEPWIESWDEEGVIYTHDEIQKIAQVIRDYSEKAPDMERPAGTYDLGEHLPEEYAEFTFYTDDADYQTRQREKKIERQAALYEDQADDDELEDEESEAAEDVAEEQEEK